MHLGGAATMPSSEQHTATAALVLDVLERSHEVGDAAQAGKTAESESPCVYGVSGLIRNACQ